MGAPTELLNLTDLKQELVNYAYYKLYSLDPKSRITQTTTTFSGDDSTQYFLLATNARYIDPFGVTIDGTTMIYGTDFKLIVDADNAYLGYIYFTTAPTTGSDNISVTYGSGNGWIYPDFPRKDLGLSQYPRIGISTIETPLPGAISNTQYIIKNQIRVSIMILAESTLLIDTISHTLKNAIIQDAKRFYNFRFIRPDAGRPLSLSDDASKMIPAYNQDYIIPDKYEAITYNT